MHLSASRSVIHVWVESRERQQSKFCRLSSLRPKIENCADKERVPCSLPRTYDKFQPLGSLSTTTTTQCDSNRPLPLRFQNRDRKMKVGNVCERLGESSALSHSLVTSFSLWIFAVSFQAYPEYLLTYQIIKPEEESKKSWLYGLHRCNYCDTFPSWSVWPQNVNQLEHGSLADIRRPGRWTSFRAEITRSVKFLVLISFVPRW